MGNSSERTMQYIRVQAAILSDQKFTDLVEFLQDKGEKFTERDVFGSLVLLWVKAATHFNDGQIKDERDLVRRVAKLCQWHGDPKIWAEGLLEIHWIDQNEDGYYVHNWMEKHAREWWLKNESAEHKRQLARERAARFRNNRKRAAQEVKILREKMGPIYDESPPPPESSNAETALPTRDEALANVTSRDEHTVTREQLPPPPGAVESHLPRANEQHPANLDAPQESLITNKVQENSVTNAFGDVTSRASRDKRREERESKQRSGAGVTTAALTHQACVDRFCELYKIKVGESYPGRSIGHVGKVIGNLHKPSAASATAYDYDEIYKRIGYWFESTWKKVTQHKYRVSEFEYRFPALKDAPLENWEKGREHGEFDKPAEQFQTSDDFS